MYMCMHYAYVRVYIYIYTYYHTCTCVDAHMNIYVHVMDDLVSLAPELYYSVSEWLMHNCIIYYVLHMLITSQ